jgi:CxxC motif-containing protein (DUF1111 family)
MLGRFGWKAGAPTIADQSAGAFSGMAGSDLILVSKDDQIVAEVLEYVFE